MKILYHHRTLAKDGQNVHIEELTSALRRQGHELVFVGPSGSEGDSGKEESDSGAGLFDRVREKIPRAVYELLEFLYSIIAYRRLSRAYREHKPDILYERYNLHLLAGKWLKSRYGVPYLLEVNAPLAYERGAFGSLSLRRFANWTERTVWRSADVVMPVTDQLANFVRDVGVGEEHIRVIPNGINRDLFQNDGGQAARTELGLDGRTILGFTGYMRDWHGLNRVVDLIADNQQDESLHFLVIGDGPARADLEARAQERGVSDRISMLGVVGRDRIAHYVSAFDVALQPEVVHYASPLKLFEYMTLGRAIVAPDRENIREVLSHEHDALLFDPDSQGDFESAVLRLCRDPELRQRVGAAASDTIDQRDLTWDGNARRVVEFAEGLLERR